MAKKRKLVPREHIQDLQAQPDPPKKREKHLRHFQPTIPPEGKARAGMLRDFDRIDRAANYRGPKREKVTGLPQKTKPEQYREHTVTLADGTEVRQLIKDLPIRFDRFDCRIDPLAAFYKLPVIKAIRIPKLSTKV